MVMPPWRMEELINALVIVATANRSDWFSVGDFKESQEAGQLLGRHAAELLLARRQKAEVTQREGVAAEELEPVRKPRHDRGKVRGPLHRKARDK